MELIETIELLIDDGMNSGINAISFVNRPAIERDFVHLNEQKIEMKAVDNDKRIVVGLALIPNKLIRRVKAGYEYNITFSEETVRKAAEKYLKTLKVHNTTVDHKDVVGDVYLTESWIVEDPTNDKSNIYNLDAPKGSWVVAFRVENDDVWKKIKDGEYLGFSIEGVFKDSIVNAEEESALEKINTLIDEYKNSLNK